MPDSIVRTQLVVEGGPAALAQLQAYRAELTGIGAASTASTRLNIDSSAVRAATSDVASLGSAHASLGGKTAVLGMDVSAVEQARASVKGMQGDIVSLASTIQTATPILALGTAVAGVTAFAAQYQTMLTQTANQTTLATGEIVTMDKAIRSLPTGSASLQDIATGFKNITDLGYSAADATKIATEEAKAASATGANQADVMLAVTSAMKEYNAAASDAAKYTNVITEAAKLGNTSLQAWADGTRTGTAYAAAFGVSLQEADAFMVALTRHGFDATEASTQLRGVIQHIVADPKAAAQETIANVKQATGIDLTPDFGPDALKTQGLTKIMQDLHDVTIKTGNEAFVNSLIPALRGGTGAIVTITQAYNDSTQALGLLSQAATGAIDPVNEGFNRISQTAGYQFGEAMKQLKFDTIDLGATFLPVATGIIEDFEKIPAGAVKAAAEVGLAFAAIKTATAVGSLVDTGINAAHGLIGGGAADTAATTAQSAATTEAAASTATLTAALAENTAATLANTAAKDANAASDAAMLAGSAAFVAPVVAETTALEAETVAIGEQTAVMDAATVSRKTFTAATLASNLAIAAGLAYGAQQLDQAIIAPDVKNLAARQLQDINKSISNGQSTLDEQIAAQQRLADSMKKADDKGPLGLPNPNIPYVGRLFPTGLTPVGEAGSNGYSDTQIQAQQEVVRQLQSRRQQEAAAAQVAAIKAASIPPDTGVTTPLPDKATTDQNTADAKTAADSQAAYTKQLNADVAAARKQAQADAVKAQKDGIQEASDAQVAAATKSADAWKAANAEIGAIDLSKGLASLGALGAGIDRVVADLAAMGESDSALTSLAGIVDGFAKITDAETKASVAYQSYMGLLSESDTRIQALDALRKKYDDAADAALKMQKAGQPLTADQQALIASRPAVDANIDAQKQRIQTNQAGDLVAAVKVAPDTAGFDDAFRQQIASQGGAPAVAAKVTADTKQAESDLTAFENKDRAAIVQIKADTKDAIANVDAFLAGIPTDKTVTVHVQYTDPQGNALPYAPGESPTAVASTGRAAGIDYAGGGDFGGTTPSAPGGGGAMAGGASIRYSDYQRVVGQYPGSPLNNQASFNDLTSVAAQTGVDPRVLMAIMQTESGYGANAGLIGKQFNYGGMGVNDRGFGHDSGVHATDGGPEYAGYNDFKSFLMDISAWVKQNGTSFSNYQTADQGQGKNSTLATLQQQVPLVDPSGVQHSAMQSGAADSASSGARDRIVAQAIQSIGQDKLVNYCQQFIEETLQGAIGTRGPTAGAFNATAGFRQASGAGLETHTPQKGDLVYYPSGGAIDPNNPSQNAGHVAIYMGDGQQVSTYDGRPTPNGDQYAVHTEAVAPGARYISVGLPAAATSAPSTAAQGYGPGTYNATGGTAASGTINLRDPNTPDAQAAAAKAKQDAADLATALSNVSVAAGMVNKAFAGMDPPAIAAATAEFQRMQPILEKNALAKLPADASDADKQLAVNAAWGQSLEYEAAYAKLLGDIEHHTGDLAADTQKVADIVGGPMADAYGKAAAASAQMAAATATVATLTDQHNQVVAQRQAADQASSRAATEAGWAQQDASAAMQARQQAASNSLADRGTAENDRYTQVQRDEQDRQRALAFSQQVQATDLQNSLTDLQKSQQSTVYNRTSREQTVAGAGEAAATNRGAEASAATLSLMHEQDLKQKDLNTKAIDAIQLQIREQAKQANLESYNLETETIRQQRQHENIMAGLASQQTAQQRTFAAEQLAESQHQQAIARSTQLQQWQEQDRRQAEDAAYTAAVAAQNRIKETAQASLDSANQALAAWQATGVVVATAAQSAQGAAQNNYAANPTYTRTLGSGSHAAGGTIPMTEGYSLVGEQGPEIIHAPGMAVVPAVQTAAIMGGGTTVHLNLGDVSLMLSDEDKKEIKAFIAAKLDAAKRAGRAQSRALGIN